jgi:hypothetical protein
VEGAPTEGMPSVPSAAPSGALMPEGRHRCTEKPYRKGASGWLCTLAAWLWGGGRGKIGEKRVTVTGRQGAQGLTGKHRNLSGWLNGLQLCEERVGCLLPFRPTAPLAPPPHPPVHGAHVTNHPAPISRHRLAHSRHHGLQPASKEGK